MGDAEGKRFKRLGDYGEILAKKVLEENGFEDVRNLNEARMNFPFADYYARKDGEEYLISVKTRNKYERRGKLNCRYKMGDTDSKLRKIYSDDSYKEYHSCVPAWMAISMEEITFDAYWGLISEMGNSRGIVMSQAARQKHSCLAYGWEHPFRSDDFLNIYQTKG